jgi:hypothetical protein
MGCHGSPWHAMGLRGRAHLAAKDCTTIEVPIVLRDLIARERLHARQAYHEVIEEAVLFWLEQGGWGMTRIPLV